LLILYSSTLFQDLDFPSSFGTTSTFFLTDCYLSSLPISVVSHFASFRRVLSNSSGMFQFLLLCFVLSIVPLYRHFFDGLIRHYVLAMALKVSSVLLSNVVYLFYLTLMSRFHI
jgi:hypothetical protein